MKEKIIRGIGYAIVGICYLAFVIFLIGGCIGNVINVDEKPYSGLHWKP